MKILDVEQGSIEWLIARQGLITGTRFADCFRRGDAIQTLINRCVAELTQRYYNEEAPAEIVAKPLQWGRDHEGEARGLYEFENDVEVRQVGFVYSYADDLVGFSPDGLVDPNGQIEIKCPMNLEEHIRHWRDGIPKDYLHQVKGGLWVTNRDWCDFLSYHPSAPPDFQLVKIRVEKDLKYNQELSEAVLAVADEVRAVMDDFYPEWREKHDD